MKIRKGFVSNSSSSSFVCDVCGNAETIWDGSLSDAGMCECVNGHVFCEEHIIGIWEDSTDVPAEQCPLCSLNVITDHAALHYLLKKQGLNLKDVEIEIRNSFKSSDELYKYINI